MEHVTMVADTLENVPMEPIFVVAHNLLVALGQHSQPGAVEHAKKNPLASWFVAVTSMFSGGIMANFLLGKAMPETYFDVYGLGLATVVWYLVFFAPMEFAANLGNNQYVNAVLLVLKEVHRARGVQAGAAAAVAAHAGNPVAFVVIAGMAGSGGPWLVHPMLSCFTNGFMPLDSEFFRPGFATKYAFLSAGAFLLHHLGYIGVGSSTLLLIVFVLGALGQLLMHFNVTGDPTEKVEAIACNIAYELPNEIANKAKSKAD